MNVHRIYCLLSIVLSIMFLPIANADSFGESSLPGTASGGGSGQGSVSGLLGLSDKAPSKHNETFAKLRAQCEKVACEPGKSDVCVEAANILLGEDPPDFIRDQGKDTLTKAAMRLLEKAVDTSDVAKARAYDLYDGISLFGIGATSDTFRAAELMDMMLKSGFIGGKLRMAKKTTSLFSVTAKDDEKRAACNLAKSSVASGALDPDTRKIAEDIIGAHTCTSMEPAKP